MKRCGMIYYTQLSDERKCGKKAVAILDKDKPGETLVCAECAKKCHPRRLTWIEDK